MEAGFSGSRAGEALPRASPVAILRDPGAVPGLATAQPPVLLCHGWGNGRFTHTTVCTH